MSSLKLVSFGTPGNWVGGILRGDEERWSRKLGPGFKVDRMTKKTIQNVQEKEPLA